MGDDGGRWYQEGVIYQLHVRAFSDSNADGIGDFRGLTSKLGYIRELGVSAIWLLPFYPSPLRDDGYDIADYTDVHPNYGSLRDFRTFLREARRQGLRVITEIVLNHTSDQHRWFQDARRAPEGDPRRDFYVWSDTSDRYRDARIIFKDFEVSNWTWDQAAGAYYWHRFYSHQPDLNYDSPVVRDEMLRLVDFWFELGVDGVRLDAIPYLYEREGTNCENLPETHEYLKTLRRHVNDRFDEKMILAEANQWPEDAVAYFGDGDECDMAFHFPLMPRMFMAIQMEDRFPIIDILEQTPPIPDTAQWAMFLRNHDELTLEMVTDEERDYMYRVYAADPQARINLGIRRRLAPLLGNDRKTIELMNSFLFSLPGTPIVYYGDEIGMGDNIYLGDRNGVRTPMQWSADRNAGFSRANPQRLYLPVVIDPEYHAEAVNVEAQLNNPRSLLWWMRRIIGLRNRHKAFGRGSLEFLFPRNRKVLVYVRAFGDERILVVANLSRQVQYVELDLSRFEGLVPVELFGHTTFPPIGDLPYFLTLGPHDFYWLSLTPAPQEVAAAPTRTLHVGAWTELFVDRGRAQLEDVLPAYLRASRWFGGKGRRIKTAEIVEAMPLGERDSSRDPLATITFVSVSYTEGDDETYVLPLTTATGERADELAERFPHSVVARVETSDGTQLLVDATWEPGFGEALLEAIGRRKRIAGHTGRLVASTTPAFRRLGGGNGSLRAHAMGAEQSNTSIAFDERFILKLFRRIHPGVNPDLEIGRFLTERVRFENTPSVAAAIEHHDGRAEPATVAIVQEYVPNEGDAWEYTLDEVRRFYERVMTLPEEVEAPGTGDERITALASVEPPTDVAEYIGPYLDSARMLGERTAELHLALSSDPADPAFAPERITTHDQRSMYQSMRSLTGRVFRLLAERADDVPEIKQVIDLESEIIDRFRALMDGRITAARIRCHGDFHLGQVLFTGRDFVIIDFEGEPARPVGERRIKRPALRDVAGMLRSFQYAAYTPIFSPEPIGDPVALFPWARLWSMWVSATFLRAYLDRAGSAPFIPTTARELEVLLDALVLEKAVYELAYEVNNRPDWVKIPILGVTQLMETP